MAEITNDNDVMTAKAIPEPDAHGQAAIILVESLIHGLVASSVISVEEAVEIVEIAADVKAEIAEDLEDSPATMRSSLTMLKSISLSLQQDLNHEKR